MAESRRLEDPPGAAFLLYALGFHAAGRFGERITTIVLTPPQVGLLRAIAAQPGLSQQAVAQLLGTPPSRLVGLVDALAEQGFVERRRNPADRRLHALHLTDDGHATLTRIASLDQEHDDTICRSLDTAERAQLRTLLARMADDHGLTPGVHPGYGRI